MKFVFLTQDDIQNMIKAMINRIKGIFQIDEDDILTLLIHNQFYFL